MIIARREVHSKKKMLRLSEKQGGFSASFVKDVLDNPVYMARLHMVGGVRRRRQAPGKTG